MTAQPDNRATAPTKNDTTMTILFILPPNDLQLCTDERIFKKMAHPNKGVYKKRCAELEKGASGDDRKRCAIFKIAIVQSMSGHGEVLTTLSHQNSHKRVSTFLNFDASRRFY
jgi:hypothetical protein